MKKRNYKTLPDIESVKPASLRDLVEKAMETLDYPAEFSTSVAESAVYAWRRNQMVIEDELEAFSQEQERTCFDEHTVLSAIEELKEEVDEQEIIETAKAFAEEVCMNDVYDAAREAGITLRSEADASDLRYLIAYAIVGGMDFVNDELTTADNTDIKPTNEQLGEVIRILKEASV